MPAKVGVNIYHQQYLVNEQSAVISAHLFGDHLFIHTPSRVMWWHSDKMGSQSDAIEVNVVSSPESSSRNTSPEPENFRNITCFPVIKTNDCEKQERKETSSPPKNTATQKTSGSSTNFSISSILSRSEPTVKKNGFLGVHSGAQGVLETGLAGSAENSMLSRWVKANY